MSLSHRPDLGELPDNEPDPAQERWETLKLGALQLKDPVTRAEYVARIAHKGQKRKNKGEDYVNHPIRVASRLEVRLKPVGLLHDVVEDTWVTLAMLSELFDDITVGTVDSLTRREGESYLEFILRIRPFSDSSEVKLADLEDNLSDLKPGSLRDKYELARHLLRSYWHGEA